MKVLLQQSPGWSTQTLGKATIHLAGDSEELEPLLRELGSITVDNAQRRLRDARGHFALIVETPEFVFACVDRIRSRPLYYGTTGSVPVVSNSARLLRAEAALDRVNTTGLVEFTMTGYVTGRSTLFEGLRQLQAGELLLWRKGEQAPLVYRYYRYYPQPQETADFEASIAQYAGVVDEVFARLSEKAAGRPIWVPLSGGLDSRLIVCKLHELGYPQLTTFSYGPRLNHDAKVARQVADRLKLPWLWVPSTPAESRRHFDEPLRRSYWDYADGLSIIPSMREWHAIRTLQRNRSLPDNAVVVNGQTGDFLTGGHIPARLAEATSPDSEIFYRALIDKHWSLWTNWKTEAGLAFARRRIHAELHEVEQRFVTSEDFLAQYESWEYQERQCKFVINGQRLYEFLGLDWQLPHWDGAFLDFWAKVPFPFKFGQRLYKTFLQRWDYQGLFAAFDPFVWRWPLHMMWVLPLAKGSGLLFGSRAKGRVYKFFWYFSHYRNHYAMYGYRRFLSTMAHARSPISLQVAHWLVENGFELDPAAQPPTFGGDPERGGAWAAATPRPIASPRSR